MKQFWFALVFLLTLAASALAADSPQQLLAQGRVDDAIQTLQVLTSRAPADAESYNLLCRAYFMLEEWDRGIPACERAVNLQPANSLYHLWLARVLGDKADKVNFFSAAGLVKKVHSEFERAVRLDPQSWEARTDLAEFDLEAPGIVGGGKDKARSQAEALASLNPPMAHYVMGRIAEKNKGEAAAEREYRAAIEASHGGAHAWLNLALFYKHVNRFDEMEQTLRTMQTRPMDRPESLMDGGAILLRTGRDAALGVQLLRQYLSGTTVEEGPAFKAHFMLGQLLEKQGDRKAAAGEYRAALALAHTFTRAEEALKRVER
jgi:tetratricopeptide (TPR) repeat protein